MIAAWIDLPIPLRLSLLGVLGFILGILANAAIYRWAYFPAPISPWSKSLPGAPRRSWVTRLPVVGWWARAGESEWQLQAARERLTKMGYEVPRDWQPRMPFWVRPMLIELALGFALPWLYWYETQVGQLLPPAIRAAALIQLHAAWFHWMFLAHVTLLVLMVIATFIDFDEQMIPDRITIPGTLAAMLMGTLSVHTFLPVPLSDNGVFTLIPCTMNAPGTLAPRWTDPWGLTVGLMLWSAWCFALANRVVILRRGWRKAMVYFFAVLRRDPMSKWLLLIWVLGLLFVAAVWLSGGQHWLGLTTVLMGMVVGGGTIWAVRLVASAAMGEEAMGFGDVTLMAMIGGFVGWQATGAAFFIAPLTSIFIVVINFLVSGQRMTPFGPYLCAGTVLTVLLWPSIWNAAILPALLLGPAFGLIMFASLVAMGVMLGVWRAIKLRLGS